MKLKLFIDYDKILFSVSLLLCHNSVYLHPLIIKKFVSLTGIFVEAQPYALLASVPCLIK